MLTKIIRVNSKSAFFIFKTSANNVSDGGKIITIVTALLGAFTGGYTPYAGTKAPVEHFSRGLAKELLGKRISVNCIAPGPMDTRKFQSFLPSIFIWEADGNYSVLLPTRN